MSRTTQLKGPHHKEGHSVHRIGWLRAAVLGANDGIVSTASLIVGVAAAGSGRDAILLSGVAALVAGAMSMAAGEYVSVSSQADTENANLAKERLELETIPEQELIELTNIYVARGLDKDLARQVAEQMTAHDALGAHARDELGISEVVTARPLQAALVSAATFATGALLPLLVALIVTPAQAVWAVPVAALLFLALLGYLGAKAGGAKITTGVVRVTLWGAIAMAVTAIIGHFAGTVV